MQNLEISTESCYRRGARKGGGQCRVYSPRIHSVFFAYTKCIEREYKVYTRGIQSVYTGNNKSIQWKNKVYTVRI